MSEALENVAVTPADPNGGLTESQLRKLIADLCDLWDRDADEALAEYRSDVEPDRIVSIRTLVHHAVRTARALLVVDSATSGIEVVPLARLVFECAVTAAWLLVTPGSGRALIHEGARQRKAALDLLSKMGHDRGPAYPQAERTLAELENVGGSISFQMSERCRGLHDGNNLYAVYRAMSAQSHAGLGVVDFYVVDEPSSQVGLAFAPYATSEIRRSELGIAACFLLLAVNADEIARAKPRRTTQIRKAAKRLGVGVRIVRADGSELPGRP